MKYLAVLLLAGCAGSNPLQLDNRLACTVAGDQMYMVGTSLSFFGGGAVPINAKDAAACKAIAKSASAP